MKTRHLFTIILVLLSLVFFSSYCYYTKAVEKIPTQVLAHNETNINVDKIRFIYKITIMTQRAVATYFDAVLNKNEETIETALEYLDGAIGFMYIEFTKNKEIVDEIEPKIEQIVEIIETKKLNLDENTVSQLTSINNDISAFIMAQETKIWHNEHSKYTQSVADKLTNIALYKALVFSLFGMVLIVGILFWLQIVLHKKFNKQQNIIAIQSKNAALGEMISNIAHQWRQPLSIISSHASSMKVQIDFGMFDPNNASKTADSIVEQCQYLSKTIDDFRNYFKPDTNSRSVQNLKDIILRTQSLVSASMVSHDITIYNDMDDCQININDSLLIQVLINILNNAKDALNLHNENSEKYIFVKLYEKNEKIYLTITDNAGGIKPEVINKIFEPYFTTKHQSIGTGIGLFMTMQTVQKHFNGTIYAKNISYDFEGNNYTGAQFTIILPSNLK